VTTSVGTHGLLPSPTDTPSRTRRSVRTTANTQPKELRAKPTGFAQA
jgi:hypothetical protein